MEAGAAQLAAAHHRVFPPWESLPLEVLGRCLRSGPGPQEHAPFATSKSCAKAVLASAKTPCLAVCVGGFTPAVARVLRWTTEWDVGLGLRLHAAAAAELTQPPPSSLQPLLRLLQQECTGLPNVSRVWCEGVLLDACGPAGLEAVFPNLKRLTVKDCPLPTGQLPLAGSSNLQHLELRASHHRSRVDWLPQLQQLATLPSLSSLAIDSIYEYYPTSILPLLAGQLTDLCLVNNQDSDQWPQFVLEAAAQLSQLQTLTLSGSSITAQNMGTLARLTQLQALQLPSNAADADQLLTTVLQFPHLTHLSWDELSGLQGSYTDQPCTWKQLKLRTANPRLLARLPLHSLTHPLQLGILQLAPGVTAADVQAAVDNLARSAAPTVCSWQGELTIVFADRASIIQQGDLPDRSSRQATAALNAAAPLVPQDITAVAVKHTCMDTELVSALQQAVPATVTTLHVNGCFVTDSFWPQLARSFPQLELLSVLGPSQQQLQCGAADLMGYFCAASAQQQLGTPQAAHVELSLRCRWIHRGYHQADLAMFEYNQAKAFQENQDREAAVVNGHLQQVGFRTPGGSPTTVRLKFVGG